jgi:cytochrome c oxidase assembly protein subunit 15
MNDKFIADDIVILNIFSKELFSNPSYVQLFHRFMAYFILFYSCLIYIYFRKDQNSNFFKFIFFALVFQVILGILTLVSGLNIYLASLHQMGSILLLSSAIYGLFCSNKAQNIIDTQ